MEKDLTHIFNRFTGMEIPVHEAYDGRTGKTLAVKVLSNHDPVVEGMEKAARDNGLSLRVCFTGKAYPADHEPDRVNVHVDKMPDGAWRVSNRFDLG